ncbi:hypothetical protein [Streptomyces sp. NPDC053728]|uniref:hypothetical protein n=1 Tax=Streptomyces sp. NPDC053728 TaxID=3155534 RepID=UPI00342E3914
MDAVTGTPKWRFAAGGEVPAGSDPDGGAAGEAGYSCTTQRPSSTSNSPASRIALTVVR